jgi:hypothetical protein
MNVLPHEIISRQLGFLSLKKEIKHEIKLACGDIEGS